MVYYLSCCEVKMAEKPPEIIEDEYFKLWVLIAQAKDAILAVREREYYQYNVRNERRAVIMSIVALGGEATPIEISRLLFRKINSVSEMLTRMEEQGLIERVKHSGRSKAAVRLTDKGYETYQQSFKNRSDKNIFSVLTKKQRENLAASLQTIRDEAARQLGVQTFSLVYSTDFNHYKKKSK